MTSFTTYYYDPFFVILSAVSLGLILAWLVIHYSEKNDKAKEVKKPVVPRKEPRMETQTRPISTNVITASAATAAVFSYYDDDDSDTDFDFD